MPQPARRALSLAICPAALALAVASGSRAVPNAAPDRTLVVIEASLDRVVFETSAPSSSLQLCLTNTNVQADPSLGLLPDDRFLFALPPGLGSFSGPCDVTIARSTAPDPLDASDFACAIAPGTVTLTRVGQPKSFLPGDTVCARVTFGSSVVAHDALHFRFEPRVAALPPFQPFGVHRVASTAKPQFFTIDVVDPISGPTGARGPEGARGAIGPIGPRGAIGARGPMGSQGDIGSTGAIGMRGLDGPAGPQGATGLDGATGATGPIGPLGPVGSSGPDGVTGAEGLPGARGPRGVSGPSGPLPGSDAQCRRFFYLTRTQWDGSQAASACDAGFHMAARAELGVATRSGSADGNTEAGRGFIYDTGRGFQLEDSGFGAPGFSSSNFAEIRQHLGWIRTGGNLASNPSDDANCWGWTSASPSSYGRAFGFQSGNWPVTCDSLQRVWCIED